MSKKGKGNRFDRNDDYAELKADAATLRAEIERLNAEVDKLYKANQDYANLLKEVNKVDKLKLIEENNKLWLENHELKNLVDTAGDGMKVMKQFSALGKIFE